ncbi:hypothetical protein ANS014_28550 [Paraclostridium bifermentans]|nr:hypothetical protein ANS014_28550 [Paraclostridium bifermentans]
MITNSEVDKIVVLYKDRLIRFGYELIRKYFVINYGTTIEIIDNTEKNSEQELVEEMIQIVTVFRRLQGKRSHKAKKMIKELLEDDIIEES